MIVRIIIFIGFIIICGLGAYTASKGLISQDKEREDKWAEYEHRKK